MGGITYPLLADFWPHGSTAQKYGVLRSDGRSERAIFVIDKMGEIRYVDVHDIDQQPDNNVLFRVLAGIEGVPVPEERIPEPAPNGNGSRQTTAGASTAPVAEMEEPAVVMYCTDWCPACRRARAFFKINNVSFDEINITRDRAQAAKVRAWTGGYETTPTFDVRGTIVVNFNVDRLSELLGIQA